MLYTILRLFIVTEELFFFKLSSKWYIFNIFFTSYALTMMTLFNILGEKISIMD